MTPVESVYSSITLRDVYCCKAPSAFDFTPADKELEAFCDDKEFEHSVKADFYKGDCHSHTSSIVPIGEELKKSEMHRRKWISSHYERTTQLAKEL